MGFGWMELMIIFGIILLIFGASRIPQIARAFGQSVGEFEKGMEQSTNESGEQTADNSENEEQS